MSYNGVVDPLFGLHMNACVLYRKMHTTYVSRDGGRLTSKEVSDIQDMCVGGRHEKTTGLYWTRRQAPAGRKSAGGTTDRSSLGLDGPDAGATSADPIPGQQFHGT